MNFFSEHCDSTLPRWSYTAELISWKSQNWSGFVVLKQKPYRTPPERKTQNKILPCALEWFLYPYLLSAVYQHEGQSKSLKKVTVEKQKPFRICHWLPRETCRPEHTNVTAFKWFLKLDLWYPNPRDPGSFLQKVLVNLVTYKATLKD